MTLSCYDNDISSQILLSSPVPEGMRSHSADSGRAKESLSTFKGDNEIIRQETPTEKSRSSINNTRVLRSMSSHKKTMTPATQQRKTKLRVSDGGSHFQSFESEGDDDEVNSNMLHNGEYGYADEEFSIPDMLNVERGVEQKSKHSRSPRQKMSGRIISVRTIDLTQQ